MAYSLSLFAGAGWQFFDNNGNPLSGGKLYTYSAGSTTPINTYTDNSGVNLNTNPIILDSAGRPSNEIWVDSSSIYKFVLKTSTDVLIGTWDNIPSLLSSLNVAGTNNGVVYFNSVGAFTSGANLTFDGSNLGVSGAATIGSNLNVAGPTALTGNVTASGTLSVTGTTTLNSDTNMNGNALVGGTTTLNGTLSVAGNVINTLNITGTLSTSGTTTLATSASLNSSPSSSDNSNKIATTAFVRANPTTAKAWVNFDGTLSGTITPRANHNVGSVTKNGTGDYTLNFTNALADANYSCVFGVSDTITGNASAKIYASSVSAFPFTMSTTAVRVGFGVGAGIDTKVFCVNIFGN